MFSTLSERGAEATLDALSLGATDYVTKPSNLDMGSTSASITAELIPKIRALCHLPMVRQTSAAGVPPPALKGIGGHSNAPHFLSSRAHKHRDDRSFHRRS